MIKRTLDENLSAIRSLKQIPRRALEVGALPDRSGPLASTPAIPERFGINLSLEGEANGMEVLRGDARALPWPDEHFDLVVTASTLEHVPDFWRAADEMKRVLAPGGTLLVSTPGFTTHRGERAVHGAAKLLRLPDVLMRGTITMRVHDAADYYRFSEDAYRQVLLAGLVDVRIWQIMLPTRIFGCGVKPEQQPRPG